MRLVDRYGRVHTDLRVSLTDRCSLRCSYCMPAGPPPLIGSARILTRGELVRAVGLLIGLGIRQVRLTGGEPLLRPDVVETVAALRGLPDPPTLALTTNALRLAALAAPLAAAGLARVNISLDTLRRDRFRAITGRDRLVDVLAGITAARAAGLTPVKVNAVLLRGVNDDEAVDLLDWALGEGVDLRFVEQMPIGAPYAATRATMVAAGEILARLGDRYRLDPVPGRGSLVDGGPATVGVIAAVTRPFCGDCDRLRLTADGQLRPCLFARDECDLRGSMRGGADDAELAGLVHRCVAGKRAGHGIGEVDFLGPRRPMSAIGG